MADNVELSPAMAAQEAVELAASKTKPAETTADAGAAPDKENPDGDSGGNPDAAGDDGATVSGDAKAADNADDNPGAADDDADTKAEKDRSKPASKRIAELTKARREAERRNAELEARLAKLEAGSAPANDTTAAKPDPNNAKYEFGEADPEYIADLVEWKAEQKFAERETKARTEAEKAKTDAAANELNAKWAETAEKAVEKYPDFHEKVIESAANQDWELLPLSAAAVQGSDVADDIAYHLATHPEEAKRLADAERGFHMAREAAMRAGLAPELANMMAAPHLMRGKEIFDGLEKQFKDAPKKQAKIATDAPEPPTQRARGAGGQFTQDFTSESCDLSALNKAIRG